MERAFGSDIQGAPASARPRSADQLHEPVPQSQTADVFLIPHQARASFIRSQFFMCQSRSPNGPYPRSSLSIYFGILSSELALKRQDRH